MGVRRIGPVVDIPGYYYKYEWTVDSPTYEDVVALCQWFDDQKFVRCEIIPQLAEGGASEVIERVAKIAEDARAKG
jgi:hypothetical protein